MSSVNDSVLSRDGLFGRRDVLRIGGITIGASALIAACGKDSAEGPLARVGAAPSTTGLPTAEVDDIVLLRTAASVELSVAAIYERFDELGLLSGEAAAAVTRFRSDHEAFADAINELVTMHGGEAWTCSNPRFDDVVAGPILARIEGTGAATDGTPIEPSDDPTRDALNTVNALESLLASTHQSFVPQLVELELRSALMSFGELDARHAAVIALQINPDEPSAAAATVAQAQETEGSTTTTEPAETPAGVPDAPGQASEAVTTTTTATETTPLIPVHAIPGAFGNLGVLQLVVGAPNAAGTRFTANLETASLNSYIYEFTECPA